jgi:membrane protein
VGLRGSRADRLRRETRAVVSELVEQWREDRVSGLAAEIAFFGILGLFPTLLATAAALGSLEALVGADVARQARDSVVDASARVLTDEADQTVEAVRSLFDEQRPGLLTFGILVTVYAMSRGFAGVIRALDVAYDVEERRTWLSVRATAVALSVGSVVVAAATLLVLILGPLLGGGRDIADLVGLGDAFAATWDALRGPFAFGMLLAWAATVFHVAPNHTTPWRWDLPGALFATVAWLAASVGFRFYLEVAAEGNQVFGVLGGALTVLFWLYLLAIGLLVGAELNAVLQRRYRREASAQPELPLGG